MGVGKLTPARPPMPLSLPKSSIGIISIRAAALPSFPDTKSWAIPHANGVFISSSHPAGSSMLITPTCAPPLSTLSTGEHSLWGLPFIKTEAEAVRWAKSARDQVERLLGEPKPTESRLRLFPTGDLNEPSHQDWTAPVVTAGRIPISVAIPPLDQSSLRVCWMDTECVPDRSNTRAGLGLPPPDRPTRKTAMIESIMCLAIYPPRPFNRPPWWVNHRCETMAH